jgi:hypothetical protein
MSGKLLQIARNDFKKIIQGGGFEESITISNPSTGMVAVIKGLHSKHWISFDGDGNAINSKNAHISLIESTLVENGFETRDPKTGNVNLSKLLISVSDSTNIQKKYVILETFPSETTGVIVCVLGDYKGQ